MIHVIDRIETSYGSVEVHFKCHGKASFHTGQTWTEHFLESHQFAAIWGADFHGMFSRPELCLLCADAIGLYSIAEVLNPRGS